MSTSYVDYILKSTRVAPISDHQSLIEAAYSFFIVLEPG